MIEIVIFKSQSDLPLEGLCSSLSRVPANEEILKALGIGEQVQNPFYFKLGLWVSISGMYENCFDIDISDTFPVPNRDTENAIKRKGWANYYRKPFFVSPSSDPQLQCARFTVQTHAVFEDASLREPLSRQMRIIASAVFGGTTPFSEDLNPLNQFVDALLPLFLKIWFSEDGGVRIDQQIKIIDRDDGRSVEKETFADGLRIIFSPFSEKGN